MSTLKDIASEAGVHVATASSVLNAAGGNTRVSEGTRHRVLAAAKKLAYIPNESARRLRKGKSNTVGFLGGDLRNPFFAELTAALEMELAKCGLQLLVSHVGHSESASMERTMGTLQQQGVQRIIYWEETTCIGGTQGQSKFFNLPIGFTTRDKPGIWLDLGLAIQLAVQEMVRRGYRSLGFFAPKKQEESPSVTVRSRAFVKECKKRGLSHPVLASYRGESWDLDAAAQGAVQTLKANPQVQAWMGFNDIAGLGLLSRLPKKDSSRVFCFDGTVMVRCWPGSPPHLDLKICELARRAAAAVAQELPAKNLEGRKNWLCPTLVC